MFPKSLNNENENNSNPNASMTQITPKRRLSACINNRWKYNWMKKENDQNRVYKITYCREFGNELGGEGDNLTSLR